MKQYKEQYKALGSYGTLGLEIAISIAFGFLVGRWIDGKLHSEPIGSVIGFFLGCGAAVKAILRTTKEMTRAAEREEKEQGNPAPLFPSHAEEAEKEAERKKRAEERARERSTRERVAPMGDEGDEASPSEEERNGKS